MKRGIVGAGMVCALVLGRLYGLTAAEALFRIQCYHDCRRSVEVAKRAFSCPQSLSQRSLVERCLLHTDPIYNTVEQKSRWKGTKFSGAPRNNGVPQLEDLKLRDEPRDPRDNKSWQIRKSERRPWRSHVVEEGAIVQVEEEPSERMKNAHPVEVVQSPTMRSLRPRTVKQELDLAKKKKFVRTKLPRAEKTIERLEEEEAERARAKSPARFTPIRRKSRASFDSVENW